MISIRNHIAHLSQPTSSRHFRVSLAVMFVKHQFPPDVIVVGDVTEHQLLVASCLAKAPRREMKSWGAVKWHEELLPPLLSVHGSGKRSYSSQWDNSGHQWLQYLQERRVLRFLLQGKCGCVFDTEQRALGPPVNKTGALCSAQASHQPSEWCIRFAQMCRCVFTNRHKAVLFAWLNSMVPLEEPQNHWFILSHSMLLSPKGHH